MKKIFLSLYFFIHQINIYTHELVVVIMVKNEEPVIVQTLQPYLNAGVKRIIVLDTGSTDETIAKTQSLFAQYPTVQGYIFEQPFINFAESRNYALECAEKTFTDDCFLYMPDAEWYTQNIEDLITFCYQEATSNTPTYSLLIRNEKTNFNFRTQRLFRAHQGVRFCGVVHEVPNQISNIQVPDTIWINWNPSDFGNQKSQKRWVRDKDLLLAEIEKNPHDPRTMFYLAQTYDCLGELEMAAYWYKQRANLENSWIEERFIATYRLAGIYNRMNDWEKALHYYLKAYNMHASRIEPLIHIANHYWTTQEHALGYLFICACLKKEYPSEDVLFIEKEHYDYTRYDLLGCFAWYVQEYTLGLWAVEQALKKHPEYHHLHVNQQLYQEKLHPKL